MVDLKELIIIIFGGFMLEIRFFRLEINIEVTYILIGNGMFIGFVRIFIWGFEIKEITLRLKGKRIGHLPILSFELSYPSIF